MYLCKKNPRCVDKESNIWSKELSSHALIDHLKSDPKSIASLTKAVLVFIEL
jgi:hypothetical protein